LECFSLKLPRNRHPERSDSQIYRVTPRDGAESKDPEDAYLAYAVRSFSTTEARRDLQFRGPFLEMFFVGAVNFL
jgi:hypothetical protein